MAKTDADDAVILAAVNAIGALLDSTVISVVLVDGEGRPFLLPHPDLALSDVRTVFRAFADGAWNASKST